MEDRVAVFVDWDNLFFGARSLYGSPTIRIDVAGLLNTLVGPRRLMRAYIYTAEVPAGDPRKAGQDAFLTALRSIHYVEVRLGKLVRREAPGMHKLREELEHKGFLSQIDFDFRPIEIQKGVDVRMALDMVELAHANAYSVAVLASGDGDLAQAAQRVRDQGKWVELYHFGGGASHELLAAADVRMRFEPGMIPLLKEA